MTIFIILFYNFLFLVGPRSPLSPVDVQIKTKHAQEVTISWLVPMVTYTQERYTLFFSTDKNAFLRPFSSINGSTDLTLVDQVYSIRLTGLQGNTAYYYRIQVENTAQNTNLTPIMNFTTPSPCKLMIINSYIHVYVHVHQHVKTCLSKYMYSMHCMYSLKKH